MTILVRDEELNRIREAGRVLRKILASIAEKVKEGVTTFELDRVAEDMIRREGAEPAFKGFKGYPSAICASVNEVVVHGIPSSSVTLNEGDIVGIDIGIRKNGYYVDAARTFAIGKITEEAKHLIEVTKQCLVEGEKRAINGNRVSDISNTIQTIAEKEGFEEVRTFVGHGIGRQLHEDPEVPNWGEPGKGLVLKSGLVLAIEPMINIGTRKIRVLQDGWTAVTEDGKLSCHFEDTIIVGTTEAEVLT